MRRKSRRKVFAARSGRLVAVACAWLAFWPLWATAREQQSTPFEFIGAEVGETFDAGSGDLIIDLVHRGDIQLSEAIFARLAPSGDDILLPLEEFALLQEFPILQTPEGASGWFISEDRQFRLNVEALTMAGDQSITLRPEDVVYVDDLLFVSARRLAEVLPLDFSLSLRALTLVVTPRGLTPIDERRLREERIADGFGTARRFGSIYSPIETPYQIAGVPAFDVDLGFGYFDRASGSEYSSIYDVRAFGDFAYMSGRAFVSGVDEDLGNATLQLERVDPRGNLLGPADATRIALGDISSTPAPLISGAVGGRGVRIERRSALPDGEFDRATLDDVAEPNYDVELYRNDILIAADKTGEDGAFRFEDIPLLDGVTEFRLEFYGPLGQRRTDVRRFERGSRARAGNFNYDLSVTQVGETVFGVSDRGRRFDDIAVGGVANASYGVTDDISLKFGVAAVPIPGLRTSDDEDTYRLEDYGVYGFTGVDGQFRGVSYSTDLVVDDSAGAAAGLGLSTVFGKFDFSARQENFFNNFESNQAFVAQGLDDDDDSESFSVSRTSVDVGVSGVSASGVRLNSSVGSSYVLLDNDESQYALTNIVGATGFGFSFGNSLRYATNFDDTRDDLDGSVRLNYSFSDFNIRSAASYEIAPESDLTRVSAGVGVRLPLDVSLNGTYTYNFGRSVDEDSDDEGDFQSGSLSIQRDFGAFNAGLSSAYTDFGDSESGDVFSAVLTLSFNTFTDTQTLETYVSSDPIARRGAARTSAFVDSNQNGVWDDGEKPVGGVDVYAGRAEPLSTDEDGSALTIGLRTGRWQDVALDPGTVNDPSLSALSPGRAVLPRPGVTSEIALPLTPTADISGGVFLYGVGERRPLPNIIVEAVKRDNAGEEVVITTRPTEFDGSYFMEALPVGDYRIRINAEQARRLALVEPKPVELIIEPEAGLIDRVDLAAIRSGE